MNNSYSISTADARALIAALAEMISENIEQGLNRNPFNFHWFLTTTQKLGSKLKTKVDRASIKTAQNGITSKISITLDPAEVSVLYNLQQFAISKGAFYISAILRIIIEAEHKKLIHCYTNGRQPCEGGA